MRIIGPYNDPNIDYAQMAQDVTNDALEVNKENKQLRKLLSECKERLWLVSNTLGVCGEYGVVIPEKLRCVIDQHLKQNLELQNKIEEVLE